MNNVLSLSIENQNHLVISESDRIIGIYKNEAKDAGKSMLDYTPYILSEFDKSPEHFNNWFEFDYSDISAKAKEERRNIIERLLALAGQLAD